MAAKSGKGAAALLATTKRSCKSYYDLLGVPATAHLDDIKKAFRKKVLLLHPDKNQDAPEEAAELFSLVQVAYNTLSQVELRDKYDASLRASGDERLTPLMLEGNEIWQAFEVMDKFRTQGFAVLSKVDELERRYKIPAGQLRFREGVPCAGYESGCRHIRRLSAADCTGLVDTQSTTISTTTTTAATTPITPQPQTNKPGAAKQAPTPSSAGKKTSSDDQRIFLCHRHNCLHMCAGDHCTADEQICPVYALWLVERWMDARRRRWDAMFAQGEWSVQVSHRPGAGCGLPYWFNAKTGRSLWVDEWERDDVLRARDDYDRRAAAARAVRDDSHGHGHGDAAKQSEQERLTPVSPELDAAPRSAKITTSDAPTRRPAVSTETEKEQAEKKEEGKEEEEERHVCTYEVCHRHGYEELDRDVWVCHVGRAPHLCTRLQCHLTRREQNGSVVCWATRKLYAAGSGEEEYAIGDYEASVLYEDKEAKALGVTTKTLTYVSETTGEVVTAEVEVPRGLKLNFAGPGLIAYGGPAASTLGKRGRLEAAAVEDEVELDPERAQADEAKLTQRDIKRIKRLELDLNEEKRREREEMKLTEKEDVAPEEEPREDEDEDDVVAESEQQAAVADETKREEAEVEPAAPALKAPLPPSHARYRLRRMMVEKEQQVKQEQREREEDIYAHASDTIYSIYGGSLDLVGHRKEEEWETIQGFAGGFEGVQEEEEEERDVETEAKEMKALRHKKLEYKAKQHVGLIEGAKKKEKTDKKEHHQPDAASAQPIPRRH